MRLGAKGSAVIEMAGLSQSVSGITSSQNCYTSWVGLVQSRLYNDIFSVLRINRDYVEVATERSWIGIMPCYVPDTAVCCLTMGASWGRSASIPVSLLID